jgi:eukaryotic-like serine/threonine-protein kinase
MMPAAALEKYGDYQLVRYLTAGGMADLYLAEGPARDGYLVVKKIQPRYVEMTRVVKMFIDEGRIAKALNHPNIVKVVDVGHEGGTYFIAMEYIPGRDLLTVCRRGVEVGQFLPRHIAVGILAQALRGLVYAHEKIGPDGEPLRVVHCDVSPGNIVLSWGGTVKIVDFGIARATIQLRSEDHSVAGKYNYMAPEQIRGEGVDARSDLFALGVILYEITVGKRLFRGRPEQVMRLVLDEPIERPSAVRPDYPRFLEAIVMQALERDPDRRYQSARHLRDDLRAWLRDEGQPWDKREIAAYLRSIFANQNAKHPGGDEFGQEEDEDDDLVLEKALPQLAGDETPLEADPEDPEDDAPIPAVFADTHPTVKLPDSGKHRIDSGPTALSSTAEVRALPEPKPRAKRRTPAWVPIAAGAAAVVAAVLYFLFLR